MLDAFVKRFASEKAPYSGHLDQFRNADQLIEVCAFEGQIEFLVELAEALLAGPGERAEISTGAWSSKVEALLQIMESTLALTPGAQQVQGLLRLLDARKRASAFHSD